MIELSTIIVIGTFFLAGFVKGVTGLGLPTFSMGVLGTLISPLAAASLLIVPSFVTNIWQLLAGPNLSPLVRRLWPMMVPIALGTLMGSSLLAGGETRITTAALGAALVVYSCYTLFARQPRIAARLERRLSPLIGGITGLVTGATGVFVIPAVPYLQALGLERDDLVQALGLSFTVSTIALTIGLGWHGALQLDHLAQSTMAVLPAFAGVWVGQSVRSRIKPLTFRRWFLITMLVLGTVMVVRAVV